MPCRKKDLFPELPALATLVTFMVLFLALAANAQAIKSTVTDILSNADQYDGKMVQVEGKVLRQSLHNLQAWWRRGNPQGF
jgi:hypothetical protein